MSSFERRRSDIRGAIVLGLHVESSDPELEDMVATFTEEQVDWLASWLASENFGRLP